MNKEYFSEKLSDTDWVLARLSIALQLTTDEAIIKKATEFEGIEQYLIIREEEDGGCYSIKMTKELLDHASISEDEAWHEAMIHICRDTTLISLDQMMADLMGADYDASFPKSTIHVITTTTKTKGASAILNREALRNFAKHYRTRELIVLPSSKHEMLIIPFDGSMKLEDMSAMVKEVNATEVDPKDRLTDRAYLLRL